MSNSVFPSLIGLDIAVKWRPKFASLVQQAVSGQEQRIQLRQYPIYEIDLKYEVLRSDAVNLELQNLLGFFMQMGGSAQSFLYTHPEDNSATAQGIGAGNGTTTAFQLARSYGGFVEPVMNPNAITGVYNNGVAVPTTIANPTVAPTLGSVAGGTIAATTYYVKVALVDANGGETLCGPEATLAVAANNLLTVTSPAAVAGAVGYEVYVSTATGTETEQTAVAVPIGTNWTLPTTGLVAGAAQPVANTTGYSLGALGVVTFNTAPPTGSTMTWTGTYYYRARFAEDSEEAERFAYLMWNAGKVSLVASLGSKIP